MLNKAIMASIVILAVGCSTTSPRPIDPPTTEPVAPPEIPQIPRQKPSLVLSDCGNLPTRPVFSVLSSKDQPRALATYIGRLIQYGTYCAEINESLIEWIYDE